MFSPKWQVWRNRRGRVKGVAIVHRCSDYGLELHSSLAESERLAYCEELCRKLNGEHRAGLETRAALPHLDTCGLKNGNTKCTCGLMPEASTASDVKCKSEYPGVFGPMPCKKADGHGGMCGPI